MQSNQESIEPLTDEQFYKLIKKHGIDVDNFDERKLSRPQIPHKGQVCCRICGIPYHKSRMTLDEVCPECSKEVMS